MATTYQCPVCGRNYTSDLKLSEPPKCSNSGSHTQRSMKEKS